MSAAHQQQGELYCPTCEQTYSEGERCKADNTRLVRIAAPADTLIGRELDGRYTIVEKLGQGGMGAVYRGTQHSVGREVAIKVVAPQLVSDGTVIKRFLREAKLASRLVHPNAVAVLDFGQTDDGLFYLVMELVDGRTLESVILEGPLPPVRLARVGMQICDALEGAHALKIIHRDLKPQNVMVMRTGRDLVKVLDFGIAKSLTPDSATVATMTNAGSLLGTPAYMPPELVGGQPVDARADLYSLGCMLFVAATGKLPFEADTVNELIAMHACEPAPAVTGVPPRLAAVIGRLLEKQPADRFQSAGETRDALEAALAGDSMMMAEEAAEAENSTRLGWKGQSTAFEKGPSRQRLATPIAGVPTAPSKPRKTTPMAGVPMPRATTPKSAAVQQVTPVGMGRAKMSREEEAAMVAMPTLAAGISQEVHHTPVPAAPVEPQKKSRKGLLIGLGAGVAVAAGVVTFLALRSPSDTPTSSPTTTDHHHTPKAPAQAPSANTAGEPEPAKPSTPAPAPPDPQPKPPDPEPQGTPRSQQLTPPTPKGPDNGSGTAPKLPNIITKPKTPIPPKPPTPKVEPKKDPEPPPVRSPITKNPGVM